MTMAAVLFEPVHPQLRELWDALGFDAGAGPDRTPRPRRAGAVLVITGLFMLGVGLGGLCATVPI